jgi:hypothetical protein
MADVTGDNGELINRLITCCHTGNESWTTRNFFALARYTGLLRREPFQREQVADNLRQHLTKIVTFGLREDLLVRALRDELDNIWTTRADVATAQERVGELRTDLEHIRDNPVDYLGRVGNSIDEVIHNAETTLAANGLHRSTPTAPRPDGSTPANGDNPLSNSSRTAS